MGTSATTWAAGESGNRGGRPASMRTALRKALNRSEPPPSGSPLLDQWAWQMVTTSVTWDRRLELMRFIEGTSGKLPDSAA